MKKSLIAAALALAGVAAHATTVSSLVIGSTPVANVLLPYQSGVTPVKWDASFVDGVYTISFDFKATDALVFAWAFDKNSALFSDAGVQSLASTFNGVVLAYNPLNGGGTSVEVGAPLSDLPTGLAAGRSDYVGNGSTMSGRVVLSSKPGDYTKTTTFELQVKGLDPFDPEKFDMVANVEAQYPQVASLFTEGVVGFASVQPNATIALNGVPAVPEASSVALTLAGLGVVGALALRRRQRHA